MQPAVVRKLAGLLECILELLISVEHRRGENVVIMIHRVWSVGVSSWFVQATPVPFLTVKVCGVNAKLSILT